MKSPFARFIQDPSGAAAIERGLIAAEAPTRAVENGPGPQPGVFPLFQKAFLAPPGRSALPAINLTRRLAFPLGKFNNLARTSR